MRAPLSSSLVVAWVLSACAGAAPEVKPPAAADPRAATGDADMHARMEAFRHLGDPEPDPRDDAIFRVPAAGAPSRGDPLAPVTIVEFGDYQCGFCVRAEATLAEIQKAYGARVRVVWRDEPLAFHDRARPAAELAREARAEKGDAGFWAAHDALMAARGDLGDAALDAMARRLGLDPTAAAEAIAKGRHEDAIDDDVALGDDVGADGTPTFFVNGRRIGGAQPFDAFKVVIDAELARRAAAGAGPPPPYEEIVKDGLVAPDPKRFDVAPPKGAPTKGDPGAPVVIEEFADFQCPYCLRAEESLRRVLAKFPSQVRLVWRHLPLPMHEHAELAAEASAEAKKQKGDPAFWAMHDRLLANAGTPHGLERPALVAYAKEIGLDVAAFQRSLDSRSHAAEVTTDAKAAEALGIRGTPAFLVGGYELDGAAPYVHFRKLVQKALARPKD